LHLRELWVELPGSFSDPHLPGEQPLHQSALLLLELVALLYGEIDLSIHYLEEGA
jgi:hypothetical protein